MYMLESGWVCMSITLTCAFIIHSSLTDSDELDLDE